MAARGRVGVHSLRTKLKAVIARAESLSVTDPEVLSDYARYLCVLVSGFVEHAVYQLVVDYCSDKSNPRVAKYVESQISRTQNINSERLLQIMRSFEEDWARKLDTFIDGPRKDSLNSCLGLRNQIAHGGSVSLSLTQIKQHHKNIDEIIDYIESLLA